MSEVILIDCDGTLTKSVCWTPGECLEVEPNKAVVEKVNSLKNVWIIIYTARADELLPATVKWLRKHNIKYHAISNNKIPAGIGYVDDKSITIDKFLKLERGSLDPSQG